MSKRKAFNFYFSYYDIAKELSDKDRLAFYDAIIQRQFYGIETELSGLAKFAYISQKHSIDSQVNGWESKMKEPLNQSITEGVKGGSVGGTEGGIEGGIEGGSVQEKGEEKEKGKEKEEINNINFDKLLSFINSKTGRNFKIINEATKKKYNARLKEGYKKDDILNAIINAVNSDYHKENGFKYLTPEFFSRADKLNMYSSINNKSKENNVKSLIPKGVSFSGPQY